jgi:hypothetical protein
MMKRASRHWPLGTGQWARLRTGRTVVLTSEMRRSSVDEHATIAVTPLDLVIQLEDLAGDVETVVLDGRFAVQELAREVAECYPGIRVVIGHADVPRADRSPTPESATDCPLE